MEKAWTKASSFLIPKKAKEGLSTVTLDLSHSLSNSVEEKAKWVLNKLKGKTQKPLQDLLREHHLPAGLFPQNIVCYEFEESRSRLVVHFPGPCEASFKDASVVRYATRVKATLSKGKLTEVEGMKTKVFVWVKVTSVTVESYKSDKLWFMAAGVKRSRPKDAYETPREAIRVEEF